jgi:hypothetical protein
LAKVAVQCSADIFVVNQSYWEFSSELEFLQKLENRGIFTIQFDKNYRKDLRPPKKALSSLPEGFFLP